MPITCAFDILYPFKQSHNVAKLAEIESQLQNGHIDDKITENGLIPILGLESEKSTHTGIPKQSLYNNSYTCLSLNLKFKFNPIFEMIQNSLTIQDNSLRKNRYRQQVHTHFYLKQKPINFF